MPAPVQDLLTSIGLLVLRVGSGGLLFFAHGWPKIAAFAQRTQTFSDPLGVGSTASLVLAIFAEAVCAAAVALGVLTRAAAIPVVILFAVIAFGVHADDPWSKKEFPLVFAMPFLALVFTGPGAFSVDRWLAAPRGL